MTEEELSEFYDIEIDEDGSVWDRCEGKAFDNLQEWAIFIQDLEEEEDDDVPYIKTGGKRRYDDDY